jgi:hypothetical protein
MKSPPRRRYDIVRRLLADSVGLEGVVGPYAGPIYSDWRLGREGWGFHGFRRPRDVFRPENDRFITGTLVPDPTLSPDRRMGGCAGRYR